MHVKLCYPLTLYLSALLDTLRVQALYKSTTFIFLSFTPIFRKRVVDLAQISSDCFTPKCTYTFGFHSAIYSYLTKFCQFNHDILSKLNRTRRTMILSFSFLEANINLKHIIVNGLTTVSTHRAQTLCL